MNLTKEECLSAFMNLSFSAGSKNCDSELTCDECLKMCDKRLNYEKDCTTIEQLINEYFTLVEEYKSCRQELEGFYEEMSNPPLKLDKLEEDMWVWDNKEKLYLKIYDVFYTSEYFSANRPTVDFPNNYKEYKFEENRFYAREVKE